jgi:hypothetical protein
MAKEKNKISLTGFEHAVKVLSDRLLFIEEECELKQLEFSEKQLDIASKKNRLEIEIIRKTARVLLEMGIPIEKIRQLILRDPEHFKKLAGNVSNLRKHYKMGIITKVEIKKFNEPEE